MDSNPRAEIGKLITENISEPAAAARLAALAFGWWAQAAEQQGNDRVELLDSMHDISNALAQIQSTLQTSLPQVVARARPGNTLQQKLEDGQKTLVQTQVALQRIQAELEPLLSDEKSMRAQAAEISALQTQLNELRHLQSLAGHAAELREQLDELERHLPPESMEAGQLEKTLSQTGEKLILLQETALANLRERIRQTLEKAASLEAEIRQAVLDLRSARDRYRLADEALTPDHRETLRLYQAADQAVARALPGAHRLEEVVQDVERKLGEADLALKNALEANEKEKTLQPLPYTNSAG